MQKVPLWQEEERGSGSHSQLGGPVRTASVCTSGPCGTERDGALTLGMAGPCRERGWGTQEGEPPRPVLLLCPMPTFFGHRPAWERGCLQGWVRGRGFWKAVTFSGRRGGGGGAKREGEMCLMLPQSWGPGASWALPGPHS